MPKSQSRTIHIGNEGEHYLASQLARYCIVRDVSQGRDAGIDLYCEIVTERTRELSLHFFCQVKTQRRALSVSAFSDELWNYWGGQPVPVFLFLIRYKDEDRIQSGSKIWVYDIPYLLAKRDAKVRRTRVPERDVAEKFLISEQSNNKDKMSWGDFINGHIPWSYGLWHMRRFGLVGPNPEVAKKSQPVFVGGFSYIYRDEIEQAVRNANTLGDLEAESK